MPFADRLFLSTGRSLFGMCCHSYQTDAAVSYGTFSGSYSIKQLISLNPVHELHRRTPVALFGWLYGPLNLTTANRRSQQVCQVSHSGCPGRICLAVCHSIDPRRCHPNHPGYLSAKRAHTVQYVKPVAIRPARVISEYIG